MSTPRGWCSLVTLLALVLSLTPAVMSVAVATPVEVFSTDFEGGIPFVISAPGCALDPVQGWGGLGTPPRQFGGTFLRYTSVPILSTTLTLTDLPPHEAVDVRFLLAVIDSWDGTELFQVRIDGTLVFSHWFQLATGDTSSYLAPPGALLSSGVNLGYSNGTWYNHDRAYDLGVDPTFLNIPHTASTLVVEWSLSAVSGPAADQWQGGDDESWAIDGLSVAVHPPSVGVPVPTGGPELVLHGAIPNPTRGSMAVEFVLPDGQPAVLDVLDVAGRRVAGADIGHLGAGHHRVDVSSGRRLPAGVYFIRLAQGGRGVGKPAVVIE